MQRLAELLASRLRRAIDEHIFPGCVAAVVSREGERAIIPLGCQTYDTDVPAIGENAVFDIASVTKVVPTSTLALMLIERGIMGIYDPLIRFVPEFSGVYRSEVTLWHLLTHTLDFGFRLSMFKDRSADEIIAAILRPEFASAPGTRFAYSNATSILLGMAVERAVGKTLDIAAQEMIFDPLGMRMTSFRAKSFPATLIVPTEIDPWRGRAIRGETHDESGWKLRSRMVAGSAGLFSTAADLLVFLSMMLRRGKVDGRRFLSETTIEAITTNQIPHLGERAGLGWELARPRFMGTLCSQRCIGKTGFTGCSIVCDIERGLGIVLLANHTWPRRRNNRDDIDKVRRDVADIVWHNVAAAAGWG